MGVLLERERWAFVAEAFADHLRWNTSSQRNRGVGVAEAMEVNPRKVALVDKPFERLRKGLRVDRLTVLLAEEEVSIPVAVSPFLLFGELALAVKPWGASRTAKLARVSMQPAHSQRTGCAERAASAVQVLGATMRVAYHRLMSRLMAAMPMPRDSRYRLQ